MLKGNNQVMVYMRNVREALTNCFDFVSAESMGAFMVTAYCHDLMGNAAATRWVWCRFAFFVFIIDMAPICTLKLCNACNKNKVFIMIWDHCFYLMKYRIQNSSKVQKRLRIGITRYQHSTNVPIPQSFHISRNYMEFAKAIATQLPQVTVDHELVFQFYRVCSEVHNSSLSATPKLLQHSGASAPCYQVRSSFWGFWGLFEGGTGMGYVDA